MELLSMDDNYELIVDPLIMGIECIDKYKKSCKNANIFLKGLTYTSLMYTPYLDYYLNYAEEERAGKVLKDMECTIDLITPELIDVITWYKQMFEEDPRNILYTAARNSANAVRAQLSDTATLLSKNKKNGDPVYTLKDILVTIQQVPMTMDTLDIARAKVLERKKESRAQVGSKNKNIFEDGL